MVNSSWRDCWVHSTLVTAHRIAGVEHGIARTAPAQTAADAPQSRLPREEEAGHWFTQLQRYDMYFVTETGGSP